MTLYLTFCSLYLLRYVVLLRPRRPRPGALHGGSSLRIYSFVNPEVRLHFVQPEAGGSHFPLPSTGTFGVKPGSIGDKRLLVS